MSLFLIWLHKELKDQTILEVVCRAMSQVQQQWEELRGDEFRDLHDLDGLHNLQLQLSIHNSCRDAYLKTR